MSFQILVLTGVLIAHHSPALMGVDVGWSLLALTAYLVAEFRE